MRFEQKHLMYFPNVLNFFGEARKLKPSAVVILLGAAIRVQLCQARRIGLVCPLEDCELLAEAFCRAVIFYLLVL